MQIKTKIIITCCGVLFALCSFSACSNNRIPEPKTTKTQEDYQMGLLKFLDDMGLFVNEYYDKVDWPKLEIAPGVEIFHDKLAFLSYIYYLDGNTKDIATKEDIAKLYEAYDEKLDEKFLNLYDWFAYDHGRDKYFDYSMALKKVIIVYNERHGTLGAGSALTTAERIILEQFTRDNLDLFPKEVYYEELFGLYIIPFEEYLAFRDAAKEMQDQDDQE